MHRVKALLLVLMFAATAALGQAQKAETPKAEAPAQPGIKVGDVAPDFTLLDQDGKIISLHDFKGKKNVALAFYIFAFTGG